MCEHRLPGIDQIDAAARIVYRSMPATPQYRWPLLEERAGCTVWVKHENHAPIGSFKLRGAVVDIEENAYFQAVEVIGASRWRTFIGHVLPNIMPAAASSGKTLGSE